MSVPAPADRRALAHGRVQRAALLRRIESAGEPLVLVVASSGFGKTSLIEQWAITTGAQVTWLSCPAGIFPGALGGPALLILAGLMTFRAGAAVALYTRLAPPGGARCA